jgi:hypothetical protein
VITVVKNGPIRSIQQVKDITLGAKRDGYNKSIVATKDGKQLVSWYWLLEIATRIEGWHKPVTYRVVYFGTDESFNEWCRDLDRKANQLERERQAVDSLATEAVVKKGLPTIQ